MKKCIALISKTRNYIKRNGYKKSFKRAVNEIYERIYHTANYKSWRRLHAMTPEELEQNRRMAKDCGIRIRYVPDVDALRGYLNVTEEIDGLYLGILHNEDLLEEGTTEICQIYLSRHPQTQILYTDEDRYERTQDKQIVYYDPVFKPDFNADMLRSKNYLGGLVLIQAAHLKRIIEDMPYVVRGDEEYDLYLRCTECTDAIAHLPRICYHRQDALVQKEACAIINAHYKRLGIPAKAVYDKNTGMHRARYEWGDAPLVSINIPNKDHVEDLSTCVNSILQHATYDHFEIVIIENNSTDPQTFAYYETLQKQDERIRVITWEREFNYAAITNFGVEHSRGEYILLMNNDVEVIEPDFIQEMLGFVRRDDVGICGARLLYFDDTVQHAGVIIGLGGICGEAFQETKYTDGGYDNRIFTTQDYSAVTAACLMTKKSVFQAVGGMDEQFIVAYNDIDFCLRVRALGKLVVYNPYALLHHYEYKSRGLEDTKEKLARYNKEADLFQSRYRELIDQGDPYYNKNLTRRYKDFSIRCAELLK